MFLRKYNMLNPINAYLLYFSLQKSKVQVCVLEVFFSSFHFVIAFELAALQSEHPGLVL